MGDASFWDTEYSKELDNFKSLLTKLKEAIKDDIRQSLIKQLEDKSNRLKEIKKSFGLEVRLIKNKDVKVPFDEKMRGYNEEFTQLLDNFRTVKMSAQRSELLGNAQAKEKFIDLFNSDGKNNDELLIGANKIQDLTEASLNRTKQKIEESKNVAVATLEQLEDQRKQINDIQEDVNNLDANLTKAKTLVFGFAKRLASDRVVQIMTALNIIALGSIIVYVLYTKKSLGNNNTGGSNVGPPIPSNHSVVFL